MFKKGIHKSLLKLLLISSTLLLVNCANKPVDKLGPSDVVMRWLSGNGGELFFDSKSALSKTFSRGKGAKALEDFLYRKFEGEPSHRDRVDNFAFTFTWPRAMGSWNLAEHVIGSWENGVAVVIEDQIVCRVVNTMGLSSLLFGRQLREMGIAEPDTRESDLHMMIEWTTPLR